VTEAALTQCHLPVVKPDSVLVAITGEGNTRGKAALLRLTATISQHLAYITDSSGRLGAEFLWRQLDAQYSELRAESSGGGSTRAAALISAAVTGKIDTRNAASTDQ
jgi:type I restriction enzyme S subunit